MPSRSKPLETVVEASSTLNFGDNLAADIARRFYDGIEASEFVRGYALAKDFIRKSLPTQGNMFIDGDESGEFERSILPGERFHYSEHVGEPKIYTAAGVELTLDEVKELVPEIPETQIQAFQAYEQKLGSYFDGFLQKFKDVTGRELVCAESFKHLGKYDENVYRVAADKENSSAAQLDEENRRLGSALRDLESNAKFVFNGNDALDVLHELHALGAAPRFDHADFKDVVSFGSVAHRIMENIASSEFGDQLFAQRSAQERTYAAPEDAKSAEYSARCFEELRLEVEKPTVDKNKIAFCEDRMKIVLHSALRDKDSVRLGYYPFCT